jgi:hypothetical protein
MGVQQVLGPSGPKKSQAVTTQRDALGLALLALQRVEGWGGVYSAAANAVRQALENPDPTDPAVEQLRSDLKEAMRQVRTLLISQHND